MNKDEKKEKRHLESNEDKRVEFLAYLSSVEYGNERSKEEKYQTKTIIGKYINWLKTKDPCSDCGQKYPYYVMQFDHRKGERKLFSIGTARRCSDNLEIIQKEIEKCDLVCANCHAERTHRRGRSFRDYSFSGR